MQKLLYNFLIHYKLVYINIENKIKTILELYLKECFLAKRHVLSFETKLIDSSIT